MRAKLRLELKTKTGKIVAVRQAHNAVMRTGAELIARLFSGQGTPITHVGVGTSDKPERETYDTDRLTNENEGGKPLDGQAMVEIPPESFFPPEIDEAMRVVRVRIRTTLPASAAVGTVREAGLMAWNEKEGKAILYNRVTFPPIAKGDDHELTMFWEVSFPYGDLHWLT
jgi:hypothetical protein